MDAPGLLARLRGDGHNLEVRNGRLVCPGDPPAPVVDPEASRTLTILELAGTCPALRPDGVLDLAHPEHASPELRAAAHHHQADIAALLACRSLLEERWPVAASPTWRSNGMHVFRPERRGLPDG
jgi:hypothetical protein